MPKVKEKNAKTSGCCCEGGKWSEVVDNIVDVAKKAKKKYDQVDPATKKKVAAVAAGTIAAAAVALGLKRKKK